MTNKQYDIIIIGSGMSGLYSAYNIQKMSPETSFLILEQYKKNWIGGRTSNEIFYSTEIVTGAGIGRLKKDKLLHKLLTDLHISTPEFIVKPFFYSRFIKFIDIMDIIHELRQAYKKENNLKQETFKQFATRMLGPTKYKKFIVCAGFTDYEMEDAFETLYHYGFEDNACCWDAFHVSWKQMVLKLQDIIGEKQFRFSSKVVNIEKIGDKPCRFQIMLENKSVFYCNRVILATTINTIRKLVPLPIYQDIEGQPFLRLYAKFDKKSIPILNEYIRGTILVSGPLQKIIPINPSNGIYMIAYCDNKNATALKDNLHDTISNRRFYEDLVEKSLGMPENSLCIIGLKDFYWKTGTHYYHPLNHELYKTRNQFIDKAQHPEKGLLVVGEAVSRNQGWTEGALESVNAVLTKDWIKKECL